ncbi:MAG: nickel pincer cofactor biosynthesis protein LarC [Butyrivibrio sp.]|nr:nickel pincer cofactor biosynthesis protein LarC [Butyrivibrio sp.]
MKVLYLECKMGIAGDMLASALIGLFDDKEDAVRRLNEMNVPGVEFVLEKTVQCGIQGEHLRVFVRGEEEKSLDVKEDEGHHHHESSGAHDHHSVIEIDKIIESLNVSDSIKRDIKEVYGLLAEAESKVHGTSVKEIHFHEVGAVDAVADISATCLLMQELQPDKVLVSPVNVGSGMVKTSHGVLPVPAPATAELLQGFVSYGSSVQAELCTPTGAALIRFFASGSGEQPPMTVEKLGYGMGTKEFERANCVRAILGETAEGADVVMELSCNVDDMTPEDISFAMNSLFNVGALDVFTIPIGMKKGRPGVLITCICAVDKREDMVKQLFMHTTTLGIRETIHNRHVLGREIVKTDTPYGEVRVKKSYGYGVTRYKPEFEDLAEMADKTGKSIIELRREIESDLRKKSD